MLHRNLSTNRWTRMAIDSLFDHGRLTDWRDFAQTLADDAELAKNTLYMCDRHPEKRSAELARTLVRHYHPNLQ